MQDRTEMMSCKGADLSIGHSLDLGKGAIGVGFGVSFSCELKPRGYAVGDSAWKACPACVGEIAGKVYKWVKSKWSFKTKLRRRRLLAYTAHEHTVLAHDAINLLTLSRRLAERTKASVNDQAGAADTRRVTRERSSAASLLGEANTLMSAAKQHLADVNAMLTRVKARHAMGSTALAEAKVKALANDRMQTKAVVLTILIVAGITSAVTGASLGAGVAVAAHLRSREQLENMDFTPTDVVGMEGTEFMQGANNTVQHRPECLDGLSVGIDFINSGLGSSYSVGPIAACFESSCERMLRVLQFTNPRDMCQVRQLTEIEGLCPGGRASSGGNHV